MSSYYRSSNPCFHGSCTVALADDTAKSCRDIVKGDSVRTPSGNARVLCVVRTVCDQGRADLVSLPGGLLVTPYHPIQDGNQWVFPGQLAKTRRMDCEAVYSFVLGDKDSRERCSDTVMIINGIPVATLAHHLTLPVVAHPYFGTDRVLDDLRAMQGWQEGLVQLGGIGRPNAVIRDSDTGLVIGLRQQ